MSQTHRRSSQSGFPCFQVERLEDRRVLSVTFSQKFYLVSDQAGTASITLQNMPDGTETTAPAAQVTLSFGGGTAVPGVDYTPGDQTVSIPAGQNPAGDSSQTVSIPIPPGTPSEGTQVVELDLSATPGGPPTSNAFLIITHNSDTTPPTVTGTKLLTKGAFVTGFVITFSKPMAPGPVQDVNNYAVQGTQQRRTFSAIPLKSASYDPSTDSVTLTPAGKVRKSPTFSLQDTPTFNTSMAQAKQVFAGLKEVKAGHKAAGEALLSAAVYPSQGLSQISPITDTTGNPLGLIGGSDSPAGIFFAEFSLGKAGTKDANQANGFSSPAPMS